MAKKKVPVWEAQLLCLAKKFPGLSRDQLVSRLREQQRFDANLELSRVLREEKLVEVDGRLYIPSATAAIAVLKSHASA